MAQRTLRLRDEPITNTSNRKQVFGLRRILLAARADVALMFLIVFDMVIKPFS